MRLLLCAIFFISLAPAMAAERIVLLELEEQHDAITVHFSLTGTTIIRDAEGTAQISPVDRLQALLVVTSAEAYAMQLPVFSGAGFGDFTLVEQGKTSRARTDNITTTTSWLIEPYNGGEYELPPLTITATGANGTVELLTISLPTLQVLDLEATDNDFDLLPPRPITTNNIWLILGVAGGCIAVLLLLTLYIKRHKRPRPLSPKQRACAKLTELTGDSKEKAMALSSLIRQFLDENFNLCTLEKTYREYEPFIRNHASILNNGTILNILKECDQSNYSGTPLPAATITALIEQTLHFIEGCAEPLRPDEDMSTCGKW
jgi:hypothetical protein